MWCSLSQPPWTPAQSPPFFCCLLEKSHINSSLSLEHNGWQGEGLVHFVFWCLVSISWISEIPHSKGWLWFHLGSLVLQHGGTRNLCSVLMLPLPGFRSSQAIRNWKMLLTHGLRTFGTPSECTESCRVGISWSGFGLANPLGNLYVWGVFLKVYSNLISPPQLKAEPWNSGTNK